MDVVFLLGAFLAFFLAFILSQKKNKSSGDYVLGAWLTLIALHLTYYYLFNIGFLYKHPHLLWLNAGFYILDGPIAFIYVLVMIDSKGEFYTKYLLHSLWAIAMYIFLFFDFFILSAPEKLEYIEIVFNDFPRYLELITYPPILITPIYFVIAILKLAKHRKNIGQNFSYTEQINLNWLKVILICLGLVSIMEVLTHFLLQFSILSVTMHEDLQYYAYSVSVLFIGYYGIKQRNIYTEEKATSVKSAKHSSSKYDTSRYLHSGLKLDEARDYLKRLVEYFENDKPYLYGKLNLKDVAENLDISVNHLSQVINEHMGINFFDLVNRYRVDEVKMRLSEKRYEHLTLLGIAFDSGFNSKSSFNDIFKKVTGKTPSQYLKETKELQSS